MVKMSRGSSTGMRVVVLVVGLSVLDVSFSPSMASTADGGWGYWEECMAWLGPYYEHGSFPSEAVLLEDPDRQESAREFTFLCSHFFITVVGIWREPYGRDRPQDMPERWRLWAGRHFADVDFKRDPRYGTWAAVPRKACVGGHAQESGLTGRMWLEMYDDGSSENAEVMLCLENQDEISLDFALSTVSVEVDSDAHIVKLELLFRRDKMKAAFLSVDPLTGELPTLGSRGSWFYRLEPGSSMLLIRSLRLEGTVDQWCLMADIAGYHAVDAYIECLRNGQVPCDVKEGTVHLESGRCGNRDREQRDSVEVN
ncbi:MAG: hypothetical protein Q9Q40_10060 [Acidobacteriota bacterium]|nr:hypothetical protein [Acidobacteriota bacterium]